MAKLLSGSDLALYIKERQAKQVRALKQAHGIHPTLAIVRSSDNPVIELYVRLKKQYGEDIGIRVKDVKCSNEEFSQTLTSLNDDPEVHGIIVQLPLHDAADPQKYLNMVQRHKDVDALGVDPVFTPATPLAIQWLIAGLNIQTADKKILIIGKGRLVGAPLFDILHKGGHQVEAIDDSVEDISSYVASADIIISAAGQPGLITPQMISGQKVVIDAGTTSESGGIKGDAHPDLYQLENIKITPRKGGVGPLTVSALFDNVIRAADETKQR